MIATEPMSITLRYLQTLTEIASEKNSTIIFPLPIELIHLFRARNNGGRGQELARADTRPDRRRIPRDPVERKQLVFLFMATTVVSVAIFLCGVLVGAACGADPAAPAVDSIPARSIRARRRGTDAPATPTTPRPAAAGRRDRLELSRAASAGEDEGAIEAAGRGGAEAGPTAAAPARQPEAQPPAAATPSADAQAAAGVPTAPPRRGTWVIQVRRSRTAAAAADGSSGLIRKGYPGIPRKSGRRRAVDFPRSGRADTRSADEAERVARRLEKEEQFKPNIKR